MSITSFRPNPLREKWLGFLPITASHWPCDTSWAAISKSSRIGAFTARRVGQKSVAEADPKAPLVRLPGVGLKAGEWHHVVLTFQNLDTGKPDAVTALYIDGKRIGEVKDQAIAMGWDVEKAGVYLSLGYVGL